LTAGRTITLTLALEQGIAAFEPGARVRGVASWSAVVKPSGMELRLVRETRGPGGRDFKIAETVPLPEPLAAVDRRPFAIDLPNGPFSFQGGLISLVWTLQLVALPGQETTSASIVVAPDARALELTLERPSASAR
jgi:hypothetical protein